MAISGGESPLRNDGGMAVTNLHRHFTANSPAGSLEVQHRDLRFQNRSVHPLAFSRHYSFEQGGKNSNRQIHSRYEIRDGNIYPLLLQRYRHHHPGAAQWGRITCTPVEGQHWPSFRYEDDLRRRDQRDHNPAYGSLNVSPL